MRVHANKDNLLRDVQFLTFLKPSRSVPHIHSLNKAAEYIKSEFEKTGTIVNVQKWKAEGEVYQNIITTYNPEGKKKLIVGAHYDVCGDQPGADDNASGVAGLLELVRLVFKTQPQLDYAIEFVAYSLEEPPFFGTENMGSYVHAKSLYEHKKDVLGMICLEMIGYFSDKPGSQPYPSPELKAIYPDKANFIIVVGIEKYEMFNKSIHHLMSVDSGIDVQVISFPEGEGLAGLSDQRNYWKYGYPALMINDTAFIRNQNYHTISDTADTLDYNKMSEVVNCIYVAVTKLNL